MFIIKYISNLINIVPKDFHNFEDVIEYLNEIIEYSVTKKDIKSFLLFVYLHDTIEILHSETNKNKYKEWLYLCTRTYAYEPDIFDVIDLRHYEYNLKDKLDTKIMLFLSKNMNIGCNKYFLKSNISWLIFKKNIIKLKIKHVAKIFLLYYKIIHNRYKLGGPVYLKIKNHYETT